MQTILCNMVGSCTNTGCGARGTIELHDGDWDIYQCAQGVKACSDRVILYQCPTKNERVVLTKTDVCREEEGICESIW